ncbi:MAG: YceI family protein [Verrucomicrobiaceae bacterium]
MKRLLLLVALWGTAPLHAETWNGSASITFDGTSTLHDWGGKVSAQPFKAEVIMKGDKPQRIVSTVHVKAAEMDTQEAKRDENMRKAMKAAEHPLIVGKIDAKFSAVAAAGTPARLPIELTLLGRPQNITGTISNWKLEGDTATFDLEFPVSMKTSGISVPSVLLFIRVGDGVKVKAHVTLTKS